MLRQFILDNPITHNYMFGTIITLLLSEVTHYTSSTTTVDAV
jgi:hypothetical protein